jgi:signal transduction histidine kinase
LTAPRGLPPDRATLVTLTWLDLVVATLIALATICVGQAVARYEVFTGKALPRRGFIRQWRNAVILAAGYGIVVGSGLVLHIRPIYTVLLTTVLMTAFYALFNWRSFAERELYIQHLRPFVTSQHLYDHLLDGNVASSEIDAVTPFQGLVRDVLGARSANLTTVGPFAPLVPALAYPEGTTRPVRRQMDLSQFDSPQTMCVPLDSLEDEGALWAVPLWSERGLIGVLRLGEKSDGGLYTQEEIEIARASGERLIDTYASAELARRLMALQRQRLAETQLLDRQARRMLHDDVLPQLHTAMLMLDHTPVHSEAIDLLVRVHRQLADLLHDTPGNPRPEVIRLGLVGALQKAVENEWGKDFDGVGWQVESGAEQCIQALPTLTAETLYFAAREAIRNAAHHGRSENAQQTLNLNIQIAWKDGLAIIIQDDGVGLEAERGSEHGTGQGLALHSAMLAVVGGTLTIEPNGSKGTRVTLKLPAEACVPAS